MNMLRSSRVTSARSLPAALLVAVLAACSNDSTSPPAVGFCSAIYTPAVSIVAVDSISGAPLAGDATGSLQMPGVNDTLFHGSAPGDSVLYGGSTPGTYQVTVTRIGYQPWVRSGVAVTATGVCSELNTVSLRARLEPSP
jgi:hypothetical protein